MIKVILIGFVYNIDKIPSTLFDLYQTYNKFTSLGYECIILTDVNDFSYNRNVYESISFKKVGREMLSFISQLKKSPPYYNYIFNIKTLTEKLRSIEKSEKVIVYYTGHGHTDGIMIPSGEILEFEEFKKMIIEICLKEIVIIIDCCHASGMKLNYKLEKIEKGKFLEKEKGQDYGKNVLIIASSQEGEKSAAVKYASLFTKYFIEFLDQNETYLMTEMMTYIDDNLYSYSSNKQQVNIYSSKIIFPLVPIYLFRNQNFEINYEHSYIRLDI